MKIQPRFQLLRAALLGTPLLFLGHRASGAEELTPPAADQAPAQVTPPAAGQRPVEPQPPVAPPKREEPTAANDKTRKAAETKTAPETATDKASPEAKEKAKRAKKDRPAQPDSKETPATPPVPQPEQQQAETQVRETTREVERDLNVRKTKIRDRNEAQAVIDEVLGAESRISKAEIAREGRTGAESSRETNRPSTASPEQRKEAANYFRQRLRGEKSDLAPPTMLRKSEARRRESGSPVEVETRRDDQRPRYLNEGRRYVHFQSRASVPAILLAAEAMNRVRFQPVREVAPIFYGREIVTETQVVAPPPDNFRSEEALVLSYPVDVNSMITSEDILFMQGSTQFSDPLSYDIISSLADAIQELPSDERFVVEGHASAEGSYEDNMILSQQRAERIVREIVRRGVQPNRLLPVGYGESEARHPADAGEALRQQDRRVVVFRLKEESTASR